MKNIYLTAFLCCFGLAGFGQTYFYYTGSYQTYTVPSGVTCLTVDMTGAAGGDGYWESYYTYGATPYGGRVQCMLTVTPGATLYIYVGGQGANWTSYINYGGGGYNGGGYGGSFAASAGGASDIRTSASGTSYTGRLIVAGGAGGGGDWTATGGAGGGLTGGTGGLGWYSYSGSGACGGGQTGPACYTGYAYGTLGAGADGDTYSTGGGGGGYYGGNAGVYTDGGGGGGSSYTDPTLCYSVTLTQGYSGATGNGVVIINTGGCSCSGTPSAGTIGATATTGCGSYTSVLSLSGTTSSPGITFQWKSSPDGSTWTSVSGATNSTYTATVTANVYYECVVTCTTSSSSTTSSAIELYFYPNPAAITGSTAVCPGGTITLADTSSGGSWTIASTSIAIVGSTTGIVTGVITSGGTTTVTYTIAGGCYATTTITVNSTPPLITGVFSLCSGSTTTLTDATSGGTWSSGTTSVATITPLGIVYGLAGGTTIITYALGTSCNALATITVNPAPSNITGSGSVCVGNTLTLNDLTTGGTWSSLSSAIAGVGSSSGIVTGAGTGITTITYTAPGGCYTTVPVTVYTTPATITGASMVCVGSNTTLSDVTPGGTWSSSVITFATISSGVVSGIHAGVTVISYTLGTGCYTSFTETVDSLPSPISGTTRVCVSGTTTLSDGGSGTWSCSNPLISTASSTTGIITGVGAGADTITYTLSTGCYTTTLLTVNPLPANILGNTPVCVGSTITVSDGTTGGSWGVGAPQATIGTTTGVVTGVSMGYPVLTYTIAATGCYRIATLTVNPLPSTIAGVLTICDLTTTTLLDATAGGTWSSSNTAVSTIGATTGYAYGAGIGVDTISYTITATGCKVSSTFTVQPPPSAITGSSNVCYGSTTTFGDPVTGGGWSSGSPLIASIDSTSGIISTPGTGASLISYSVGTCVVTKMITVNPRPASISGIGIICSGGATITLSDATTGGTWSSSSASVATINASSGVLTSAAAGTTNISYTLTSTGCYTTSAITINELPSAILGNDTVCIGYTSTLTDGIAGGSFSTGSAGIATVGASTGLVTGISAGETNITYTLSVGTGCLAYVPFVVNPILSVSTSIAANTGDTICSGNIVTYTATSINAGPSPVYSWKVNSSTVSGVTGNTYSYSPANGDVVNCVLTSNATCAIPNTATSNSITMVVNPLNHPTVTMFPTSQDTLCIGTIQNYSITSTSGSSHPIYLWTVNWIPVGTGITSYTYTPNNGDIIRCGMISSSPCPVPDTAFAIDTIVVKGYDTPRVAVTGLEGLAACQGNMITLTANTTWGGWGPKYYWSVNGNPMTIGNQQYTYLPADSDVISCMMISNYYCPIPGDTAMSTVTVKVDPILIVTITDSYGGLISTGLTDTMMAHVQNGGSAPAYQWYKNGIMIPGANSFRLIDREINNKDSISCMVTTGSGTACEGIKGDNWLIMEVAPTGIATIGTGISDIRLVPNPNTGIFTVEGMITGSDKDITLEITDVIGQEVYTETVPVKGTHLQHKIILDKGLANGVYILHLAGENNSSVIRFSLNR